MFFPVIVCLLCAPHILAEDSLRRASYNAMNRLAKRQTVYCSTVPVGDNFCERSCGAGYMECVDWDKCFNPSKGETCCSNSDYCPAGQYCTTDGCCNNNLSIEQCFANVSVSVAPSRLPTVAGGSSSPSGSATASGSGSVIPGVAAVPTLGVEVVGVALAGIGVLLL